MTLISFVIPTRNRQIYAASLVGSLLREIDDCQVVVCDNSDDRGLENDLAPLGNDPRLVYSYSAEKLSVVENFARAFCFVRAEYIAFLGDDDAVGPGFLPTVQWAQSRHIDAVLVRTRGRVLHYFWPAVTSAHWGQLGGQLFFSRFSGTVRPLNLQRSLRDAIRHFGEGPRQMPRFYLGIVSRQMVESVHARWGRVFGGFSPDVFSSLLLSLACQNAVVVDFPIIIPGAAPASTSAARARRSDVGGLTDNEHLGRFSSIVWDSRVPRFYAPPTVWAHSLLDAVVNSGMVVPEVSFAHLYASCLLFTRGHAAEVCSAMVAQRSRFSRIRVLLLTLGECFLVIISYSIRKIPAVLKGRPGGAQFTIRNLLAAEDARSALQRFFTERGWRLKLKVTGEAGGADERNVGA